jgi:hypothetical protein
MQQSRLHICAVGFVYGDKYGGLQIIYVKVAVVAYNKMNTGR